MVPSESLSKPRLPLNQFCFWILTVAIHTKVFFSLTPGIARLLYLEEIPVSGYGLNDIDKLKQNVFEIMKQKMIEYDGAWRKN